MKTVKAKAYIIHSMVDGFCCATNDFDEAQHDAEYYMEPVVVEAEISYKIPEKSITITENELDIALDNATKMSPQYSTFSKNIKRILGF